ncbi:MAG: hypothetical protein Q8S73_20460 [Deltaproteobacteria bacterium]|nr:hypothetical protein [Myxococcales bacterium]MDP3216493.1 hypothetical protein [Deltaproteobacteria bacterium]
MSLYLALLKIHAFRTLSPEARVPDVLVRPVLHSLQRMARSPVSNGRRTVMIPDDVQDDCASMVCLKVCMQPELPLRAVWSHEELGVLEIAGEALDASHQPKREAADRLVSAYLSACLANRCLSMFRKRSPDVEHPPPPTPPPPLLSEAVFRRLRDRAVQDFSQPEARQDFLQTADELWRFATGESRARVDDLLRAEVDATSASLKVLRDRLYQRRSRARRRLAAARVALRLDPDEDLAAALLLLAFRGTVRQRDIDDVSREMRKP